MEPVINFCGVITRNNPYIQMSLYKYLYKWLSLGWKCHPTKIKVERFSKKGPTLVAGLHLVQGHDDPKVRYHGFDRSILAWKEKNHWENNHVRQLQHTPGIPWEHTKKTLIHLFYEGNPFIFYFLGGYLGYVPGLCWNVLRNHPLMVLLMAEIPIPNQRLDVYKSLLIMGGKLPTSTG